ncbi:MAG: cyclodeaminase/cyclohydrolase family protein, partial [bacterium]|nr:cyclodeaminase/cyclohydrolase family protein [bacterium]
SMGLGELRPWDSRAQIVEYALEGSMEEVQAARPLAHMTLRGFADELASGSPAPGGGSVAALAGALAAGLAAMVPSLTVGRKGYKDVEAEMNALAAEAQQIKDALLEAIDDDTAAFNALMDSLRLPKNSEAETEARDVAIAAATRGATDVPLSVLERMPRLLELLQVCAERGNSNALSDAVTGSAMALACATGAHANVLINLRGMAQDEWTAATLARAEDVLRKVRHAHDVLLSTAMPVLQAPPTD